jgi:Spy/CpxP family protein refolding chaperone
MVRPVVLALAPLLSLGAALAQTAPAPQPYAGFRARPVKALSDEQVADLRAGRGMGLALPAELNGYPGPVHALEHADVLALTPDQRARTKALFEAMKAEAVPLGERLIREETELERLFATGTVQPANLEGATGAVGATQGRLRAAHLRYHLAMMDVLTPEQVRRYGEVRGYSGDGAGRTGAHDGHGRRGHEAHRP